MIGKRLLLVAQDADNPDAPAGGILREEGYDILVAENGAEGLARGLSLNPDLIITDLELPDINGLEVLLGIQETGPYIPGILLADALNNETLVEALRLGFVDCLKKPVERDQLIAAVERGLKRGESLTSASVPYKSSALTSLLDISQAITASLDLEIVLAEVMDEAVRLSRAEEGTLMLLDPQTEELFVRASRTADEDLVLNKYQPVRDNLAGQVVESGQPLLMSGEKPKAKSQDAFKSLLYVPLNLAEQVIGLLGVVNRVTARPFSAEDVEVLSVLANYAAIAIGNARSFEAIQVERVRFRTLLEHSSDAMLVVDELGYVVLINQGACEALGIETLDILGRPVSEAIANADLRGLFERHTNQAITRGEVELSDGRTFNAQITVIESTGRIAILQDVTHLKELDRMKTQFVTTVSHDLRSPLTAILGYVEFLKRAGELNEQQADFVERIRSNVGAMTNLINDLLDLGRIEAGMDRENEPVDITALLDDVCEALQPRYEAKGQKFEYDSPRKLPPVLGNPLRLRQAFSNLIDNAIKYTPEGGQVDLVANTTDEHVIVLVRDTGIGIPLADQPHVFEQFYRAESVAHTHQGTGLGLAIVKSIVEAHDGRVWVESKLNEGSTFTVMLPAFHPDG